MRAVLGSRLFFCVLVSLCDDLNFQRLVHSGLVQKIAGIFLLVLILLPTKLLVDRNDQAGGGIFSPTNFSAWLFTAA